MTARQMWIMTLLLTVARSALAQTPVGTAITYEGQLKSGGSPANGDFNMTFGLFDAATAGSQIGPTLTFDGVGGNPPPVTVTNGLFILQLDFTVTAYTANQARWLEIAVNGTTLSPRQALSPGPFALNTRGINVDELGKVGIGTAVPARTLHLVGDGEILRLQGSSPGAANTALIHFFDSNGLRTGYVGDGSGDTSISLGSDSGNVHLSPLGSRVLTANSNGNVGIGTQTPTAKLHLRMFASGEGLRIDGSSAGAASSTWVGFHDSTGADIGYVGDASSGDASMYLSSYIGDVILGTPAGAVLTAKDNGNVGIGTTNPAMKLTVAGDMEMGTGSGDYRHFRIGGGNSSGFIYGSYPHFGDGIHIGYNYYADANGSNVVYNQGGGISRISMGYGSISLATAPAGAAAPVDWVYLNSTGFVGIGTGLPGQRLHVVGNICATGTIAACSDERYKTHIETLGDAFALVEKLRPVFFDWRRDEFPENHFSAERQIGLIAQEVRKIVPEVVQEGSDGYLSVDYGRLTPILVEAVKQVKCEKDTQVADQQRAIGELRMENAELKARLERLEVLTSKTQTKEGV